MATDDKQIHEPDDDPYPSMDAIDFGKIYEVFRSLALFQDDTFLSMQGMNIGMTDYSLTASEIDLLRELREIDGTPQSAYLVSAFSQMWIFALYEVLRTWRQRIDELIKRQKAGTLDKFIASITVSAGPNPAAQIRRNQAQRLLTDATFATLMLEHRAKMDGVFAMSEAIRMNLAKHEMPKSKNEFPRAPGYGRINRLCGALDYEVEQTGGRNSILNRRDIAEAIRRLEI